MTGLMQTVKESHIARIHQPSTARLQDASITLHLPKLSNKSVRGKTQKIAEETSHITVTLRYKQVVRNVATCFNAFYRHHTNI